ELVEHFGIATVEAMAAGCVPLVVDRGGQSEIVRDTVDGVRWRELEQLTDQLIRLATEPETRTRMRANAIARASSYSVAQFTARVEESLRSLGLKGLPDCPKPNDSCGGQMGHEEKRVVAKV